MQNVIGFERIEIYSSVTAYLMFYWNIGMILSLYLVGQFCNFIVT